MDNKTWDNFVESSNNGTIFHKMSFLNYHKGGKFDFSFFGFFDNNNLVAGIVGEIRSNVFRSPVGSSYGSFILKDMLYDQTQEIVDSFLIYCKENNIKEIFLTPPPIIYQKRQNQQIDFLLLKKRFLIEKVLITSTVDLSGINNDVISSFDKKRRNQTKKSIKDGIKIEIGNNWDSFYPILIKNKEKYKSLPTHTKNDLDRIRLLNADSIKLFLAYKDRKPIAGVLVFVCNKNTVLIFYIAQNYSFQEFQPVSNLIYEVLKWSKANNYRFCDFGVNTDTSSSDPMEQVKSLIDFKESFSSRGFLRMTYHKIL